MSHRHQAHVNANEQDMYQICRTLGITYCEPQNDETAQQAYNRTRKNRRHIQQTEQKCYVSANNLPPAPPLTTDIHFNKAMDCIRAFELEQMSYNFKHCSTCNERRLQMKMADETLCMRCSTDNVQ